MRFVLWLAVLGCSPVAPPVWPPPPARPAPPARPDDGALARFAAAHPRSRLDEVASAAARSASADYVVSAAAVQAAMARAVGSGAWPHVLTGRGSDAQIAAQLEAGLAELGAAIEIAELGFATAAGPAGRVGAVVAVSPPSLPIAIARHGATAELTLPWRWDAAAEIFAVTPTSSRRLAPRPIASAAGQAVALTVDCAAPSAIEIRAGRRAIATVVDACAPAIAPAELPPAIEIGPPAATAIEIEMRVWELINRERAGHGVAALAWDATGHRFARGHAADMARYAYVGHEARGGASYADRVAGAPFVTRSTHENVGHAWGPGELHDAFMRSPGHRANLLARDVDHGAVGVVVDPEGPSSFYVTEFFRR